jgi:cell division protein FtsQ
MAGIIKTIVWTLLVAGLAVSLGFVADRGSRMSCTGLSVSIERGEFFFVEEEHITSAVKSRAGTLKGKPAGDINIGLLEKIIRNNPFVLNAEVYSNIDGKICIDVKERNPIVRVIGSRDSYYIDESGTFMPLSDRCTARVPVASGYIFEPYSYREARLLPDSNAGTDTLLEVNVTPYTYSLKDSLYTLARFIAGNEFWRAQVQQVYVDANHEFELIPVVGNHRILLGDLSGMEEKFEKLMLFYRKGLSKTGWDKYDTINLKYKDQVVCTKK